MNEGMDRRVDLAGSVIVAIIGLGVVLVALGLPRPRVVYDLVGPAGLPIALGSTLAIAGVIQSARTLRLMRQTGPVGYPEGTTDDEGHPASTTRAIGFMIGGFLYLMTMQFAGYLIATPIAIALGLWALHYRSAWRVAAIAVGFTIIAFIVFDHLLSVPLPLGFTAEPLADLGLVERVR